MHHSHPVSRYCGILRAGSILLITATSLLQSCSTIPVDSTLQNGAYDLYSKTVSAYRDHSPGDYADRKTFYTDAYNQIDLLEMRARVDTSAAPHDEEKFSTLQNGFVTPLAKLRIVLQEAEDLDKSGGLARGHALEQLRKDINLCFYAVLHRQTVGAPKS
jgi:hypothetical protein